MATVLRPGQIWRWKHPDDERTAKIKILKVNRDSYPGLTFQVLESTYRPLVVGQQDSLFVERDNYRYASIEAFLKYFGYWRVR